MTITYGKDGNRSHNIQDAQFPYITTGYGFRKKQEKTFHFQGLAQDRGLGHIGRNTKEGGLKLGYH